MGNIGVVNGLNCREQTWAGLQELIIQTQLSIRDEKSKANPGSPDGRPL